LLENGIDGGDRHPQSDLHRVGAAGEVRRPSRSAQSLHQSFLERRPTAFESDRIHVRDIVADYVHLHLMIAQAGDTGKK